ncbi:predicted protein [Postia placenta Mad-698-R]|uniref:Uncharacterized protein n=1 Tax=Postia placenta MAD-698-R-SB12 TaxID=670580 RepID=A0A1X6MKY6_9APHY|nr:hypothetical protein POSPLADRAFT_1050489 [Postia placenta MAD-698-R-SB12]EED81337.1 predicted protein [Postia placenta Mad-698-R]OSX56852.1 hypothetical protein POSPLADRAFT_1050489 [Postia placenta MAD-698-R-SB12]
MSGLSGQGHVELGIFYSAVAIKGTRILSERLLWARRTRFHGQWESPSRQGCHSGGTKMQAQSSHTVRLVITLWTRPESSNLSGQEALDHGDPSRSIFADHSLPVPSIPMINTADAEMTPLRSGIKVDGRHQHAGQGLLRVLRLTPAMPARVEGKLALKPLSLTFCCRGCGSLATPNRRARPGTHPAYVRLFVRTPTTLFVAARDRLGQGMLELSLTCHIASLTPLRWTTRPVRKDIRPVSGPSIGDAQGANASASRSPAPQAVFKKPFDDPYEALCREYNVAPTNVTLQPDGAVPPAIDMPVLRDAHMPTHTLVILNTSAPSSPLAPSFSAPPSALLAPSPHTVAIPINADLFAERFAKDLTSLAPDRSPTGSTLPVPTWSERAHSQTVTLPTIPLPAPHPPSVPLLLLYGLGLHLYADPQAPRGRSPGGRRRSGGPDARTMTSTSTLAAYLLPTRVIEEFPSAAAMADVMARWCTELEMQFYTKFNQGLWANVLALAPADAVLVDLVRTAWNVTAEARRIRERLRLAAAAVASVPVLSD